MSVSQFTVHEMLQEQKQKYEARIAELEDAGWQCLALGSHEPMYDVLQCDHGIFARYECAECAKPEQPHA